MIGPLPLAQARQLVRRAPGKRETPAPIAALTAPMRTALVALLDGPLVHRGRFYIAHADLAAAQPRLYVARDVIAALARRGLVEQTSRPGRRRTAHLTRHPGRWYARTAKADAAAAFVVRLASGIEDGEP